MYASVGWGNAGRWLPENAKLHHPSIGAEGGGNRERGKEGLLPENESCFILALARASCTLSVTAFHASVNTTAHASNTTYV